MPDDSIRIEYNQDLHALEALLAGVKRTGDYYLSGMREIPMPQVTIAGVGSLSFPVPETQIAALIRQATRAPYGRGPETILDESVRKVWQLPPEKIQVGGKSWKVNFADIVKQAAIGLGCEEIPVSAELYKLLIYDTGSFFRSHRDTEKAEGMFGSLVLSLPSAHAGGDLVIRHRGREARVDLSGAESSEIAFAAFYADCEHEVLPIRKGNRVCLVYNLIQTRKGKAAKKALGAPDYEKQIAAAADLLKEHFSAPEAPSKIAWLLEHQYTPEGLCFSGLKSSDAARARVLSEAAARASAVAHLSLVHIEESGAADGDYCGYGRRRRYYDDDEEEEEEEEDSESENFEIIEVSDWRHYFSHWRDVNDQPVDFGKIPLAPGELLPAGALNDEKPDEQRFMEATGNEGGSFERSYLRAALVVWPRKRSTEVLLQAGASAALPLLRERITAARARSAPAAARESAIETARKIVGSWQDPAAYSDRDFESPKLAELLDLLVRLDDASLLEELISGAVTDEYDGTENNALVAASRLLPVAKMGTLYSDLVHRHMRASYAACIDLLAALARDAAKRPSDRNRKSALQPIAESVVNGLQDIRRTPKQHDWELSLKLREAKAVDAGLIKKLLQTLGQLRAPELRDRAVEILAQRWDVFDPVAALAPALATLTAPDAATKRLWKHAAHFVLQRSEHPPEAPKDWRRDANLSCACADCRELRAFAENPLQQTGRFRLRQDRRQHLHQAIDRHALDMTHETERKGSPQTLVCTKNSASHGRRCVQYRKDIAALSALEKVATRYEAGRDILERIRAARKRSSNWAEH